MQKSKKRVSLIVCITILCSFMAVNNIINVKANDGTLILDPKVENTTNPIGIDVTNPRFSWRMDSDITGQLQTKYQIIVSSTMEKLNANDGNIWNSGVIASDRSNNIEFKGRYLQSRQRYFWKAFVWDKNGVKLSTDNSFFEMGILNKSEWAGQFISAQDLTLANISTYSIELDFRIESGGAGIVFGGKNGQFLMWQINIWDYRNQQKVYFRPHRWGSSVSVLVEKDISSVIPWDQKNSSHKLKITVDSNNLITTFIDGTQIDQRTDSLASFGQFGFRQVGLGGSNIEAAFYSNINIKKNNNYVIFQDDFSANINAFDVGTITKNANGTYELYVPQIQGDYVMKSLKINGASMFRKEFSTIQGKSIAKARLYASALGVYDAFINGQRVSDAALSPGWTNYFEYVMYQTYDITDLIDTGSNAISSIVGNGWYSGHVSVNYNTYGTDVAFLGQVEITYTDGTRQIIGTDNTWTSTKNGPYVSTDNQNGEMYDARKEIPGWSSPNFSNNSWGNTILATINTIETKVDVANLSYVAQTGPLVMPQDIIAAKTITEIKPGTYIIDIGQNIAGWAKIKIKGGKAGDTIKIRYAEMLYDDRAGDLNGTLYTENLRNALATDYYVKKSDGIEYYEPRFTFHGFQYIEITGYSGELTVDDISGVFVGSEIERTGYYNSSNSMVNQLFSNLVWSQRDNFLSVPTDCPQRDERLGYTGDAQIFARTASYNMDVNQFFKKYIRDMSYAQQENGAVYNTAPYEAANWGAGNAGWADAGIIVPWTMYLTYGDKQVLKDNYTMMNNMINYYLSIASTSEPYIIPTCAYGDWLALEGTGHDLVATAYFAYSTSLMAKIADALGYNSDKLRFEELFLDIRKAFNSKFVVESTGRIAWDSQTAYLLALKMNLLPTKELQKKAAQNLVERISAANDHLTTGFIGVREICPVLTEYGYSDLAYKLLLNDTYPSWGYEVVNGATTIWERWNTFSKEEDLVQFGFNDAEMNSFNHYAYGSIGEWLYRYSAGIEADENSPAFKNIIFQPTVGGDLSFVNSSLKSIYGNIISNWSYSNIKVPANTTGTVKLPADSLDEIKINGVSFVPGVTNIDGVTYSGYENKKAIFTVKSGSYLFSSQLTLAAQVIRIRTVAGGGSEIVNNGNAINTSLNEPNGMAFDSNNNLYIADYKNNLVRKIDVNGIITTVAGNGLKGYSGDGSLAINAAISPYAIAFDSNDNMYISETDNACVRKVDKLTGKISTIAGNGTQGYNGDNQKAYYAMLNHPTGIAVDSNNNLYIAEYVTNRIRKIDNNGVITTFVGTGALGYSGDNGIAKNATLNCPFGLTIDKTGNMYIADSGNNCIRKVDTSNIITTIMSGLSFPTGVAVDDDQNVYATDPNNNRIMKLNPYGVVSVFAGTGTAGFSGDYGAPEKATLNAPQSVVVSSDGKLYISDLGNNRIRLVEKIVPQNLIFEVKLSKTELLLMKGKSETITPIILPDNANINDVEWISSNPLVATVNNNGQIIAISDGISTITYSSTIYGKKYYSSCIVKVTALAAFGKYLKNTGFITNLQPKTSINMCKEELNPIAGVSTIFKNTAGQEITNTYVGTGTTVELSGFDISEIYTFILFGDVSCDGLIDQSDLSYIKDYLIHNLSLSDNQIIAGDLYGESDITLNDLVDLMTYISGSGTINQNQRR